MKTIIRILAITPILLGLGAGKAHAGDEGVAALGGFIAGVITGAIIDDHDDVHGNVGISVGDRYGRHDRWDRHGRHDRYDRDGHRGRYERHGHRGHRCHDRCRHHRSGHWEIKRVRVWVPGYWEFSYNSCGDRIRVWRKGYYKLRKERVWVSYGRKASSRYYRD